MKGPHQDPRGSEDRTSHDGKARQPNSLRLAPRPQSVLRRWLLGVGKL